MSKRSLWSASEDRALFQAVQEFGERWELVAPQLRGRTEKECKDRWVKHVNPTAKKSGWTQEEDDLIIELVKQHGTKWSIIAQSLPGRTHHAVKNRHATLLKNRGSSPHTNTSPPNASSETSDSHTFQSFQQQQQLQPTPQEFSLTPFPRAQHQAHQHHRQPQFDRPAFPPDLHAQPAAQQPHGLCVALSSPVRQHLNPMPLHNPYAEAAYGTTTTNTMALMQNSGMLAQHRLQPQYHPHQHHSGQMPQPHQPDYYPSRQHHQQHQPQYTNYSNMTESSNTIDLHPSKRRRTAGATLSQPLIHATSPPPPVVYDPTTVQASTTSSPPLYSRSVSSPDRKHVANLAPNNNFSTTNSTSTASQTSHPTNSSVPRIGFRDFLHMVDRGDNSTAKLDFPPPALPTMQRSTFDLHTGGAVSTAAKADNCAVQFGGGREFPLVDAHFQGDSLPPCRFPEEGASMTANAAGLDNASFGTLSRFLSNSDPDKTDADTSPKPSAFSPQQQLPSIEGSWQARFLQGERSGGSTNTVANANANVVQLPPLADLIKTTAPGQQ